jgi:hypothetical protein
MNWLMFIFTFISMAITDAVWAKYMIAVADKRALQSGIYSSLIMILGGVVVLSYTEDRRMLLAAVLGAFVGTYFTVRLENKKETT